MRLLLKALLAATALVPLATAANAQEGPEREGRWRDNAGIGARTKIEARDEARSNEAPLPRPQPQTRWSGGSGDGGDRGDQAAGGPRIEQTRWADRGGADARPSQADVAANRSRGPDNRVPLTGRARGEPQGWGGPQPDGSGDGGWRSRDDRTNWGSPNRNGDRPQTRDERGADRADWRQPSRDDRVSSGGFDRQRQGARFDDRGGWNRTWRNDRRYDWNGYRASNGSAYRLPRYYAPVGWSYGYRRFSLGATLRPQLWGENYWIDDPSAFRLPGAYGPYRWVRYYDDALLVDLRIGRIVDMVHDIFR